MRDRRVSSQRMFILFCVANKLLSLMLPIDGKILSLRTEASLFKSAETFLGLQGMAYVSAQYLGPFHGATAVPSVTRCRCRRRGHRTPPAL